jgi:hypothetical protein
MMRPILTCLYMASLGVGLGLLAPAPAMAGEDAELEALRAAARAAAEAPTERREGPEVFHGGQRSLQALNPELSVTGDAYARGVYADGREYSPSARSGFFFRGLGLHLESGLDPFTVMKAAVSFDPHGLHFGEAYVTWTNLLPRVSLRAGQFRQQLGVINRWHKHGLDQFDFPSMLQEPFGPGGLNQIGLSLDWLMPALWASEHGLTLQVTNGQNAKAFSGEAFSLPTTLVRLRSYWDLNRDTYLELGLSGVLGFNHGRGVAEAPEEEHAEELEDAHAHEAELPAGASLVDEARRLTAFGGADLTLSWEPVSRAKYAGVTWRTELLYGYKELPDDQRIDWMGGYSALDVTVWRGWSVGVRGDLAQPFTADAGDHYTWQASPYVTWWQSPWVRLHLEAQSIDGDARAFEQRVILQVVFAAGPHKHDRY